MEGTDSAVLYSFHMAIGVYCTSTKVLNPLKWEERLTILRDTARGMAYLHSEDPPMVHHDIKSLVCCRHQNCAKCHCYTPSMNSPNILLDVGLNAQLADVGFAMPMPEQIGET